MLVGDVGLGLHIIHHCVENVKPYDVCAFMNKFLTLTRYFCLKHIFRQNIHSVNNLENQSRLQWLDWSIVSEEERLDLVAMVNRGVCAEYTDAHYGHARNVIAPGRARRMDEGMICGVWLAQATLHGLPYSVM